MLKMNLSLAGFVVGVTTVIMAITGGGTDGSEWLSTLGFLVWAVSPYVAIVLLAWIVRGRRAASLVVLVGLALLGGWGSYSYVDGVLLHPDPQSGLYFVLIPFLQWGGVVIVGVLVLLAVVLERQRGTIL